MPTSKKTAAKKARVLDLVQLKAAMKPPYSVPTMDEIAQIPWNGFNVVSTFSGCGGSSLGYRMAGFRVLWASEFIPAAQEVYRANHPTTILDTRDIREVTAAEILSATGLRAGDLDLFDGSPPCASFSTSGKREDGWGKVRKYSDSEQRTDDLFFEYIRILSGLQPKTFVAENVSGLVKGSAKGYFFKILSSMKSAGYRVTCRVLDAQWLGVPQQRQRTIFVGVREDLGLEPAHPTPLSYRYTVRDVLPWILKEKRGGSPENWQDASRPASCVIAREATVSPSGYLSGGTYVEAETDLSRYCTGREWEKLNEGEQSKKYFNLIKAHTQKPSPCVLASGGSAGAASVTHPTERRKFSIAELKRICAFPDDFILTGTYAQQWERLGRAVPPVMMRHVAETVRDKILRSL